MGGDPVSPKLKEQFQWREDFDEAELMELKKPRKAKSSDALIPQKSPRKQGGLPRQVSSCSELATKSDQADPCSPTSQCTTFTAAGASTVASRMRFAQPEETLIFYDWDDTLFPTTDFFERWGLSSRMDWDWNNVSLSDQQLRDLVCWRNNLLEHLKLLRALSDHVVIVTNSRRPWVTDCVQKFAPNCLHLFEGEEALHVVYAREELSKTRRNHVRPVTYDTSNENCSQEEFQESQTASKFAAMRRETKKFYSRYPGQSWKNILSIGDMSYEHDALQEVGFTRNSPSREQLRTKLLTMMPEPKVHHVANRLLLARVFLPTIVQYDGDLDLDLTGQKESRLNVISEALQLPELKDLFSEGVLSAVENGELSLSDTNGDAMSLIDEAIVMLQGATMD